MDLAKKHAGRKECGPMKKIGVAWPNEEEQSGIEGELCWFVLLQTVGDAVQLEIKDLPKD